MEKKNIKVIGDIMLDKWIYGKYEKNSAEGKLKVFEEIKTELSLGGAGFLCSNLKNLNIKFKLYCGLSKDFYGKKTYEFLKKKKILFVNTEEKKETIIKKRFFNIKGQLFRSDKENTKINKKIGYRLLKDLKKGDVVVISDYKKGSIFQNLHKEIIKKKCITFVDPKNEPDFYKNAFLVKPNLPQFEKWCGKFNNKKAFSLLKKMGWTWLVISKGGSGVHIFNKYGFERSYKVKRVKNPNVVGAGDIFFAGLIYFYLKKFDIFTAAEFASYAATKCVQKKNLREININDFKKELIFTNGVFDILHKGHLDLLKFAKNNSLKLIVGINSDRSVKSNKGSSRPFNSLNKRIQKLKKTKLISKIIVFDEKTPLKLIKKVKPELIIKGSDYKYNKIVGVEISNAIIFKKKNNFSTTKILDKIRNKI